LDDRIRQALEHDRAIFITTTGRRSGLPRRTQMWFHNVAGQIYLTGTPYRRDWYANLLGNPSFIFHLGESVAADLPARATPVTDPDRRRAVIAEILEVLGHDQEVLDAWVADSPLMAVTFEAS
jgi:deazaflavin-dependent oxidoreductase (nitroreductase family)